MAKRQQAVKRVKRMHPTATKTTARKVEMLATTSFRNNTHEGTVKRGDTFFCTPERAKSIKRGSPVIAVPINKAKEERPPKKGGASGTSKEEKAAGKTK